MEVLNALRERHNDIPILILSARAERSDRINGLKAGADDYLTKPFFVDELEARVQALLRRGRAQHPQRLVVANMTLDVLLRRVTRGDQLIAMTALEFEIVELLMRNARRVVSRQMLSHSIWKDINRATPLDNVIDVHISRIRKKVDLPGLPKLVHTIRGVGFMLSDDPD
jgi:DNA-binding response OmpR family regulator